MPGLNPKTVGKIKFDASIERILYDLNSDFIFAPHIKAIYKYASSHLIEMVAHNLKKGDFNFDLPFSIDVPKVSGLTRPGSILLPKDRLIYQVLSDTMAPEIEKNLNRKHVFSNVFIEEDKMFEDSGSSYKLFENALREKSEKYEFCLKTDVASYFETIYQHFLVNQVSSLNIDRSFIKLLETGLSKWRGCNSHGILQGLFPSDLFGNFYLSQIDYFLELVELDYIRYVDDIYVFSDSKTYLTKVLVQICDKLRKQGLCLNESKTLIKESSEVVKTEMEFEALFEEVSEMISILNDQIYCGYGFQLAWDEDSPKTEEIEGFEVAFVERLYDQKDNAKYKRDSIIKFCLPLLSKVQSEFPLDGIEKDILEYPHLAKYYSNYFASVNRDNADITDLLEKILKNDFVYDHQHMWLLSSLLYREKIALTTLKSCAQIFSDKKTHESIRAIASLILAKHGGGCEKKLIRDGYDNESSPYMHSVILYCSKMFSSEEHRACKGAWSAHNYLNTLVCEALKNMS